MKNLKNTVSNTIRIKVINHISFSVTIVIASLVRRQTSNVIFNQIWIKSIDNVESQLIKELK